MAGVFAMASLQADTPTPHTVASNRTEPELGQPHLLLGSPHKDPASHSQAKHPSTLGDPIAFGYSGFFLDAAYAARISFDSDADRVVKIKADARTRSEIMQICDIFRAKVVNVAHDAVIVEVTGDEGKTAAFLRLVEAFGILELARTGQLAMRR